jgi:hypothetical protein
MEEVKKQVFNVINDNTALAQVFVVIFFFEDYLIMFQNTSLLNTTLDFKNIALQPFILFFIFIALSKVIWFLWHLFLIWLKHRIGLGRSEGEVYKKVSVIAFMLCILLFVYFGLVQNNQVLAPMDADKHPFLNRAVLSLPLFAAFICMIISLQSVNYNEEK